MAILCDAKIEFDLVGTEGNGSTEGSHAVFGSDCIKSAVGADTGVGHMGIVTADGAAAMAVLPGLAAVLDVLIVGSIRIAEACRLKVLVTGVKFGESSAKLSLHVRKNASLGIYDHAGAADRGVFIKTDGRAQHVSVGVVS